MFLLSKRQARAAAAGVGAALAYLAAAEVGSKKPVRVGGLFLLASASMAGLAASASTGHTKAVAVNTRDRFNHLLTNGGTIGGTLYVNDHHVTGSLYGTGGNIQAGDNLVVNSRALTADGAITSHTAINSDARVNCDQFTFIGGVANMYTTSAGTFAGLDNVCNDITTRLNQIINAA